MRTLLVLRHAKSSWAQADRPDHDRPLNARGRRDAPRIGRLLRQRRLSPEIIVSSSARRARQTAEEVATWSAFRGTVCVEPRLYLADTEQILDVVRMHGDDARRLLIVGHNPGVEQVVQELTGVAEEMPTAALAHVRLPIDGWHEVRGVTRGTLVHLWRPKELPALRDEHGNQS